MKNGKSKSIRSTRNLLKKSWKAKRHKRSYDKQDTPGEE